MASPKKQLLPWELQNILNIEFCWHTCVFTNAGHACRTTDFSRHNFLPSLPCLCSARLSWMYTINKFSAFLDSSWLWPLGSPGWQLEEGRNWGWLFFLYYLVLLSRAFLGYASDRSSLIFSFAEVGGDFSLDDFLWVPTVSLSSYPFRSTFDNSSNSS